VRRLEGLREMYLCYFQLYHAVVKVQSGAVSGKKKGTTFTSSKATALRYFKTDDTKMNVLSTALLLSNTF
jgi:hypothetical protein